MNTWIALFRGINVGGNNILPIAQLRSELESLRLRNIRSYIQSGNIVFESTAKQPAALTKRISRQVETVHGFRPQVILLQESDLRAAIKENPFPDAEQLPKTLHFFFLSEPALAANSQALDKVKSPSEQYQLTERVFYLHAPDGLGR
jgi:uncharacterized protein (DUF1697 family)